MQRIPRFPNKHGDQRKPSAAIGRPLRRTVGLLAITPFLQPQGAWLIENLARRAS
jgi:hypothetical protein